MDLLKFDPQKCSLCGKCIEKCPFGALTMEDKGIVERRMLNGNRRNFHIFLTERGRELLHLVTENFNLLEEKAFLHIPDDQKESFMQTLKQIYANLTLQEDKK